MPAFLRIFRYLCRWQGAPVYTFFWLGFFTFLHILSGLLIFSAGPDAAKARIYLISSSLILLAAAFFYTCNRISPADDNGGELLSTTAFSRPLWHLAVYLSHLIPLSWLLLQQIPVALCFYNFSLLMPAAFSQAALCLCCAVLLLTFAGRSSSVFAASTVSAVQGTLLCYLPAGGLCAVLSGAAWQQPLTWLCGPLIFTVHGAECPPGILLGATLAALAALPLFSLLLHRSASLIHLPPLSISGFGRSRGRYGALPLIDKEMRLLFGGSQSLLLTLAGLLLVLILPFELIWKCCGLLLILTLQTAYAGIFALGSEKATGNLETLLSLPVDFPVLIYLKKRAALQWLSPVIGILALLYGCYAVPELPRRFVALSGIFCAIWVATRHFSLLLENRFTRGSYLVLSILILGSFFPGKIIYLWPPLLAISALTILYRLLFILGADMREHHFISAFMVSFSLIASLGGLVYWFLAANMFWDDLGRLIVIMAVLATVNLLCGWFGAVKMARFNY